jgi:hypothetical protein
MSYWCREPHSWLAPWCAAMAVLLLWAGPVGAQQTQFVPLAETTAEWSTNRSLQVPAGPDSELYSATVGGDLLRRTQVADFDLRPLITVQHDSQISTLDSLEALVDLNSNYRTLRGEYSLNAEYHRQDAYNALYGLAVYNPLNPNGPDTAGTGQVVTGITQTTYQADPSFAYDLTQRTSLVGTAGYTSVRYSQDIPGDLVSYNAPEAEIDLMWKVSPAARIGVGPYYAVYDPINSNEGSVREDSYGINFNYNYNFSFRYANITRTTINVRVEHDTSDAAPGIPATSATTWGFEWLGFHKFLTSSIEYSIGRFLEPSSFGARTSVDQVRFQYRRRLTERLSLNTAVRLTRNKDVGSAVEDNGNRDRANALAGLTYYLTPELFIGGGYRFAYLDLPSMSGSARSNQVFITVGYHGQQPPRD